MVLVWSAWGIWQTAGQLEPAYEPLVTNGRIHFLYVVMWLLYWGLFVI